MVRFVCECLKLFGLQKNPYIPLCMACIQGTMLMYNGEDQNVEVQRRIIHDLHDVMYMSIKPKENIETLKE